MTATALLTAVAAGLTALGVFDLLLAGRTRPRQGSSRKAPVRPLVRVLIAVGRRSGVRAPGELAARVEAAGHDVVVGDVMALKAGAAATALLTAVTIGSGLPGRLVWPFVLISPVLGFVAPDLWLARSRRRRARAVEEQLADVLELVRVAVEAGLGVRRALAEVGRRHPGLLAGELRRTAVLLELGVSYADALATLGRRCPFDGIATLVAALRRAERHGAPLGDALAAQAEQACARSSRRQAEAAARAAPKIQLVVALLLVPSAMLLVAAALIPALAWR